MTRIASGCMLAASIAFLGTFAVPALEALAGDAPTGSPRPPPAAIARARGELIRENPYLAADATGKVGGFGGARSLAIAGHMRSRTNAAALADAAAGLVVEPHGRGTWLLRMPWVNVAVFETSAGLVLIDSGYAPAGPALRDALRKLSPKRVHTIVYTHHHIDHMLGAWALLEAGEHPEIISTAELPEEVDRDLRAAELTQRYNNQPPDETPHTRAELPMPTRTFHARLELRIGQDRFVLTHAPGETLDQLWVWVPTRRTVVTADYFQPFLPNAGNGKRRQRYVESWAGALRAMAALKPALALPMHGAAVTSTDEIVERFTAQARMLESIADQTVAGLNAGLRRDEAVERVALPPDLAGRDDARELYVTAQDIGKMVAQEYTGWWDGLPSDWSPAPRSSQAREIADLAGGVGKITARARALAPTNLPLACNLADLAWLAAPLDRDVLDTGIALYLQRLHAGTVPTQEAIELLEHAVRLRALRDGPDTPPAPAR